jgi:hypothetical protein
MWREAILTAINSMPNELSFRATNVRSVLILPAKHLKPMHCQLPCLAQFIIACQGNINMQGILQACIGNARHQVSIFRQKAVTKL